MSETLADLREGWEFEAKRAVGREGRGALPENFWETYSAMANTRGGVIVLGVEEHSNGSLHVVGIQDVERVERDLWNLARNTQKVSVNLLRREDVERREEGGRSYLLVRIRRAERKERPVYVAGNPMTGSWLREFDGDRRCKEIEIRRMLADADDRPLDGQRIEGFGIHDLDRESLAVFRNLFRTARPDHPFLGEDDVGLLRQLGGWIRDRLTGQEGPTRAGLLMFGRTNTLLECLPCYQLDYREIPPDGGGGAGAPRWLDRVTVDGTWAGNLLEFYRRVMPRLTSGLKVPFQLSPDLQRTDETQVHTALREALVNALVHADYNGTAGIRVLRRPEGFEFINPGLLRLPVDQVRAGGVSDCRNPSIQKMFQMMGAGEKAGSGVPKILQAWHEQHWKTPQITEDHGLSETTLRLSMASLLPAEVVGRLDRLFPERFRRLAEPARVALVPAATESQVTNRRLQELTPSHPRDLTALLKDLVRGEFLVSHGTGGGTWYTLPDASRDHLPGLLPVEVRTQAGDGSVHKPAEVRTQAGDGSVHKPAEVRTQEVIRALPAEIGPIERVARSRRALRSEVTAAILTVCRGEFRTLEEIAARLHRASETLRVHYLAALVARGALVMQYPSAPNHPAQAYRSVEPAPAFSP